MRVAAAIAIALVAACGCRGSHVRHPKPQPDPIGHLERRCEHGKLDDCVTLASYHEVGWRFDPDEYDEDEEDWEDEHLRDRDVEYEDPSPRDANVVLIPPYRGPPRTALAVDHARARVLYAHACTGNQAAACYALGRMRRDGLGGPAALAAADADFVHACDLRELRGCTAHAIALEQGLGIPADPDAGHALMRRLCDEDGHPRACANVGVHLLNDDVESNDRQAQDYLRRACYGDGDALGCHIMAARELRDRRGDGRYLYEWRRALDEEVLACDEGIGPACAGAARAYREGWSTDDGEDPLDHDDDRATWIADLFRKGCDLGDAESCQGYLLALFDGDGVRQDVRAAARIADKQCAAGYVPSCQSLGYFYEVGTGVPLDLERAESVYRTACATDTPAGAGSCSNLAELLAEHGDLAQAVLLIQKGCDLGDARGCNAGGVYFADGVWPGDPTVGQTMLRRACSLATEPEDAHDYCAAAAGIR